MKRGHANYVRCVDIGLRIIKKPYIAWVYIHIFDWKLIAFGIWFSGLNQVRGVAVVKIVINDNMS